MDFSGGVDSNSVTTLQSQLCTRGLPRNMLAWLVNGTIRNGGIEPRTGWNRLGSVMSATALYQGGMIYEPRGANPQLMLLIGGHLLLITNPDNPVLRDLSAEFGLFHPATNPQAFFVQAEEFAVIQAGDYGHANTLPLIWDGTTLRRSVGIISTNNTPAGGITPYNEIPSAGPMDYYMGRLWYAQGRVYSAGDIVGNTASGTNAAPTFYRWRDSVLKVTENPLAFGGDGFTVPSESGNIRALSHSANINSLLGQGQLYIFTRRSIYTLQVPVTRTDWIAANNNNQPLQYAVQIANGSVNDRSIVKVNGDLFFQSLEPSIRSLTAAVRNFQQWGDTPVSINVDRILAFNDRSLLWAASGIFFDNRLLQTAVPEQTDWGVIHKCLLPLNFDALSTLQTKLPPAWEGQYSGLDHFQLFTGDFGGLQRAFSVVLSRLTGTIELWELTHSARFDSGDTRIDSIIEFPAYTTGKEFQLKELLSAELWLDDVVGTVELTMDYRPDSEACWYPWLRWQVCWSRDTNELISATKSPYPAKCGPGYHTTMTLPHPPNQCNDQTGRSAYMGYQFQPRLTIKGWCRVRGLFLHTVERERPLYDGLACAHINGVNSGRVLPSSQVVIINPPVPPVPPIPVPTVGGLRGAFGDLMQGGGGDQIFGAGGD